MAELTPSDAPRRTLTDHDVAIVMTILRLLGKPEQSRPLIELEYSRCLEILRRKAQQP